MESRDSHDIPEGMFGVIACEVTTGVVVDAFGARAAKGSSAFLCFESVQDAELHCRARVRVDPATECWIYDDTGAVVGEFRNLATFGSQASTSHRWKRPLVSRLLFRGTPDGFCCNAARGRFLSRQGYGDFLVAGRASPDSEISFVAGSSMAHREDYKALLPTLRAVERALGSFQISNYTLLTSGHVRYCASCGVSLHRFYGRNGGALRDDDFAHQLPSFAQ